MRKKYLTIIGSTGSIGKQTLEVLKNSKSKQKIFALIANKNHKELSKQCSFFRPKFAVIISQFEKDISTKLEKIFLSFGTTLLFGEESAFLVLANKVDYIFIACYGFKGVKYSIEAVKSCKVLGIANKESIICMGNYILNLAIENEVKILPIDSEHNTIFQIIEAFNFEIKSITITASGGFVRNLSIESMKNIYFEQVINHPSWNMGNEISINSSTMMNKVMEIIEAYYLFGTTNIKALIHNESIVHAIVDFYDGLSIAGMSNPDMKLHIQNALDWPNKNKTNLASIDFDQISKLSFCQIDKNKYPLINLAYEFLKTPNNCFAIAMNAANEVCVDLFRKKIIKYNDMSEIIIKTVNSISAQNIKSLDIAMEIDRSSRDIARKIFQQSI